MNLDTSNAHKTVDFIGGDYHIAECKFEGSDKSYYYKVDLDLAEGLKRIPEGESILAVVHSNTGLGLVNIVNIIDNCIDNAGIVEQARAWVVNTVDTTRHQAKMDNTKRHDYLLRALEEKSKALGALEKFAMLANVDQEASKMVSELKGLLGVAPQNTTNEK